MRWIWRLIPRVIQEHIIERLLWSVRSSYLSLLAAAYYQETNISPEDACLVHTVDPFTHEDYWHFCRKEEVFGG